MLFSYQKLALQLALGILVCAPYTGAIAATKVSLDTANMQIRQQYDIMEKQACLNDINGYFSHYESNVRLRVGYLRLTRGQLIAIAKEQSRRGVEFANVEPQARTIEKISRAGDEYVARVVEQTAPRKLHNGTLIIGTTTTVDTVWKKIRGMWQITRSSIISQKYQNT